jgi:hypothetical protein
MMPPRSRGVRLRQSGLRRRRPPSRLGTGIGDAAREPEQVEAALGTARLDKSGSVGLEPGSTKGTLEVIEPGKARTSARYVGQVDVKETKDVVETLQDARKEEK